MANPKHRISKRRRRQRRSHHNLTSPTLVDCPKCLEKKRPHFACVKCGHYNGMDILSEKSA